MAKLKIIELERLLNSLSVIKNVEFDEEQEDLKEYNTMMKSPYKTTAKVLIDN